MTGQTQTTMTAFDRTKQRSEEGLQRMREIAASLIRDDDRFVVGVNGSYARREVTSGSDVDLFVLFRKDAITEAGRLQGTFRAKLSEARFEMPASGGVFEEPLAIGALTQTIGGQDDSNVSITRRMLLLLEGEWIFGKRTFDEARNRLLAQYVPETIRSEQIAMFLLNDIIRYWRTICVDLEHKVLMGGKPRAIRLIKLRFSRMLLFVAGVLAVGETFDIERDEKLQRLNELLALPTFERVDRIAGEKAAPLLGIYSEFLDALDDAGVRQALSQQSPAGEDSPEFEKLRARAQEFRDLLLVMLRDHFGSNPTLSALML